MDLHLQGKRFCLIGGTKGIGLALLKTLALEKADLFIVARHPEAVAEVMTDCAKRHNVTVSYLAMDITAPDAPAKITEKLREIFPRLDGVVFLNHADVTKQPFLTTAAGDWQHAFDNFLLAPVSCLKAFLPLMDEDSAVIFTAAFSARNASVAPAQYAAMKAALVNLTKGLAVELAPQKIRVNAICPGFVLTDRSQAKIDKLQKDRGLDPTEAEREVIDASGMRVAMHRMGRPEEVADMAAFLLSPRSGYTTGLVANIDGGTDFQ